MAGDDQNPTSRRLAYELMDAVRRLTAEPVFCPSLEEARWLVPELMGGLEERLEALEGALVKEGFGGEAQPFGPSGLRSLGTLEISGEPRPIWRGFLEPVFRIPLVPTSTRVLAYLISLPDNDFLERENHGWGWHYHYVTEKEKRTDVVLCWDTLAPAPTAPDVRGLFQEKHGQGVRARPDLWGDTKRQSMHDACKPDLRRDISEFRHPTDKASAVWPLGRSLTPRNAVPPLPPPRFPSKRDRRGWRT